MSGSTFCWSTKQTCIKIHMCSYWVVYLLVYIYIYIGNREKTTLSSRQACFVIAHSKGDFNDKNIHNHRLYTWRLHCCCYIDGLAISNVAPRDTENIKKEICRVFNQNWLRITIEANKQIINFLDVTFNLNNSTYQPFTKPNTTLQYVHRESNHPPITTKNIPAGINRRLSSLSSDKALFDQATPPPPHTKKHSTKADTTTLYTTNPLQLLKGETDNATTSSGITPHSAKTSAPTSVTDSSP